MNDQPHKRRIMIVDREFQFRFIRRLAIIAVLIVVASLSLLALISYLNLDVQTAVIQPLPLAISENLIPTESPPTILSILVPVTAVCVAVTLAVTLFFGIIASHRMAGPLFRIRRELGKMEQGNLSGDVRLRKRDDFKILAKSINRVKANWRSRIQELNAIVRELDSEGSVDQGPLINRLKKLASSFKTE